MVRKDVRLMVEYSKDNHRTQSMRLLRQFIDFLYQKNVDLSESAEHITEFTMTEFFQRKSKPTQRNYLRILKDFVQYVYDREDYSLYPRFVEREEYSYRERYHMPLSEEQDEDGVELDEDYKKFLQRYDEIGGD